MKWLTMKRRLPDSNRGWRICNPLPYRVEGETVIVDKIGHRREFYED